MKLPKHLEELARDLSKWVNESEITALAVASGFEKRRSPLRGYNFMLLHLFAAMDHGMNSSLTELCAQASNLGIHVVPESINGRYTARASDFIQRVCRLLLSKRLGTEVHLAALSSFNGVYVSDATSVELPKKLASCYHGENSRNRALLKLDCTFDLQSDWSRLNFKVGAGSDQTLIMGAPRQSLWLRDLGYYKTADFAGLAQQGSYFVSRLRKDIAVYQSRQGKEGYDLEYWVDHLAENEWMDTTGYIGADQRLQVRLIVQRVPEKVAQKRRRKLKKLKKKKRRSLSARRLKLCALNVYITNLCADQWSAQQIQQLYKVRWQIELIFKIWKSELDLNNVPTMNRYRFECQLFMFLLYVTLNHKITQQLKNHYWNKEGLELSEIKLAKILKIKRSAIKKIIIGVKHSALKFIQDLYQTARKTASKQVRYQNKNPLFHIC